MVARRRVRTEGYYAALNDAELEHRTHLQFPWAIGALLDDKGVEFIYMSAEHEDSRRCVYTDLLTWDKLQSIFAVIAVLRVRIPWGSWASSD